MFPDRDENEAAAGDRLPDACVRIEVYVGELRQLFNAMDPSPFREKDLDPKAEDFIVGWAREAPPEAQLGLLVHVDRAGDVPASATFLKDAVREFFAHRAGATRQRLRHLFRVGRTSLAIGLVFLATATIGGQLLAEALQGWRFAAVLTESQLIGGWVAMWRPLEVFLYEWWPIREEARLFDRLGVMPVRLVHRRAAAERGKVTPPPAPSSATAAPHAAKG
jgi:hypothetical protein